MPSATSTVIYPQGAKFDMDYYLKTHMPLVEKHWSPFGLQSWKVIDFRGDDKAQFIVQATLEWNEIGSFQKAVSSDAAKTVLSDIENFCDKQPVLLTGNVVASS